MQPGLLEAPGVAHGPKRWRGEDLSDADRQAADRALAARPVGLAAWPDGAGAAWLLDAHLMSPESSLWWCFGRRLVPAQTAEAEPLARAWALLTGAAEWLEIRIGDLPGAADPHEAPYPVSLLAAGLPAAPAGALVQALKAAPVDLAAERAENGAGAHDLLLSARPPGRLLRGDAEQLAEFGGYPSPELAGWVIRTAFRPPAGAQASRSVRRLAGIARKWPGVCRAAGLPEEDPPAFPEVSESAAEMLEAAARAVLSGAKPPKPADLARRVGEADAVRL